MSVLGHHECGGEGWGGGLTLCVPEGCVQCSHECREGVSEQQAEVAGAVRTVAQAGERGQH